MKLTRQAFEERYASGALRIAFIGMSNIGKSYTAKRLTDAFHYKLIEVDKLIWEELGHSDMGAFAQWQGQPYSEGYTAREKQSIQLETQATNKALATSAGNQILDTTGSVIYTEVETLKTLQETHYIVYIEASDRALESLKIQYFANPKPLIWDGHFKKNKDETNESAILNSYPNLLLARSKKYAALADKTLSSALILGSKTSIDEIYEALKPTLE